MTTIGIGIIGAGFIAAKHAACLSRIHGVSCVLRAVASRTEAHARGLAERFGAQFHTIDYRELLARSDIQVVLLCVPTYLHAPMAVEAARAGKHVICEKPLTGFCGPELPEDAGRTIPKRRMMEGAVANARAMLQAAAENGVKLMYAENWVYAPAYQKLLELALASEGALLEIRAEESHSGSQSSFSRYWKHTGGGALLRTGSHPFGGVLHLKRQEGLRRSGRPVGVKAVTAEVALLTHLETYRRAAKSGITADLADAEDWSVSLLTFEDGSRATVTSTDLATGGMQNRMEVYLSNGRLACSLQHTDAVIAYAPDEQTFKNAYLVEKLETKAGWSFPLPEEDRAVGYQNEMQDFMEAVAFDRPPLSGGELGLETVRAMYAAYVSAEEGRRVELS
jgi:predicted dehydrogenase